MSIKLIISSIWLPNSTKINELDHVATETIAGLNTVIKRYTPWKIDEITEQDEVLKGNLEERRAIMADAHNKRVKVLVEELGPTEAIKIARKSMYEVGYQLGKEAGQRLGVGNSFGDLQKAAKLLYKILGIEFKIENDGGKNIMVVNRCSLSKYYTHETCMVLSAVDEGVVNGLNQNMEMEFKDRITDGSSECIACINEVET